MAAVTTSVIAAVAVFYRGSFVDFLPQWWIAFSAAYPVVVACIVILGQPLQNKIFKFSDNSVVPTMKSRLYFALIMGAFTVSAACAMTLDTKMEQYVSLLFVFLKLMPVCFVTALPFILAVAPRIQVVVDRLLNTNLVEKKNG